MEVKVNYSYLFFAIIGFFVGIGVSHIFTPKGEDKPKDKDTEVIYIRDTIVDLKPVYVNNTSIDTIRVDNPIVIRDTITKTSYITLPKERRIYQTTRYKLSISGYKPQLDFIETYPITKIVSPTISSPKMRRWGIGIQAGYGAGFYQGKIIGVPYIGIGINYSIFTW